MALRSLGEDGEDQKRVGFRLSPPAGGLVVQAENGPVGPDPPEVDAVPVQREGVVAVLEQPRRPAPGTRVEVVDPALDAGREFRRRLMRIDIDRGAGRGKQFRLPDGGSAPAGDEDALAF